MTTSFTRSPAGDQLWNSGRQNWIFGRIGDQEGAISDPAEERNAFFLHHQHGSRHTYKPAIGVVVSNHAPILGTQDSFRGYPF